LAVPEEDVNGYGVPALTFTLRYPASGRAQRIDLQWRRWDGLAWFDGTKLPVSFKSGGDVQIAFLTPEEPGHTWRPREIVPRERPAVAPVSAAPPPVWRLPLVSIGVLVACFVAIPWLLRARAGLGVVAALTASGITTAWVLR